MSGDLISRVDVLSVLCFSQETGQMVCGDMRKLLKEINAIPSAEPERTAKVERNRCTVCDNHIRPCMRYCDHCGCRLEWE